MKKSILVLTVVFIGVFLLITVSQAEGKEPRYTKPTVVAEGPLDETVIPDFKICWDPITFKPAQDGDHCTYYLRVEIPGFDPRSSIPLKVELLRKDNSVFPEGEIWQDDSSDLRQVDGAVYLYYADKYDDKIYPYGTGYKVVVSRR